MSSLPRVSATTRERVSREFDDLGPSACTDQVVQFLAEHGARLDIKDKQGKTPLDSAMGLAGGVGFDGSSSVLHESTATLVRKLMEKGK